MYLMREEVIRQLIKDDQLLQELLAQARLKVEAERRAKVEREVQSLQRSTLNLLKVRFPVLAAASQTQQAVATIQSIGTLKILYIAVLYTSDEHVIRVLFRATYSGGSHLRHQNHNGSLFDRQAIP